MYNDKICVVGLGYVGLPLAVEFSKHFQVIGYDINSKRVEELRNNIDVTKELDETELKKAQHLKYTTDINDARDCNVYIVTVPTPVDQSNIPDLTPLQMASKDVGKVLRSNDIVIYESTVYPGATEEYCVPILEDISGLTFNKNFYVGYSPERINPGDKQNTLVNILKVVSGSNSETLERVDELYKTIIKAGTHKASSIKVAEASKVIENSQRDLNIAFFNELAIIFDKLDINTKEVIDAASTKWNFIRLQPGLVGGHCISVDPYYLTHKAQSNGYHPDVLLSGRKINDGMGQFIADKLVREIIKSNVSLVDARVLIKGFTFKENCPDIRNTRVVDIKQALESVNISVDIYDPLADYDETYEEYGIKLLDECQLKSKQWTSIIVAVAHDSFLKLSKEELASYLVDDRAPIFDVKNIYPSNSKYITL